MAAIAFRGPTSLFDVVNLERACGGGTGNALGVWHFVGRKMLGGR